MDQGDAGKQPAAPRPEPAVVRGRTAPTLQRKLVVGASDDPFEREADRVADRVMALLRGPALTGRDAGGAMAAGTSGTRIVRHSSHDHGPGPEVGMAGGDISSDLAGRITRASGGSPIAPRPRAALEGAFGADFSAVRVHADSELPRQVAADAFTVGSRIHFAPGLYDPSSTSGQRLLSHELAHVVQQGGSTAHRHTSDCGHDHTDHDHLAIHDLDLDGLQRRSIAEEITLADTGYAVRRHSSWEHMLIGDLDPTSLATLGAQSGARNMGVGVTVQVGTDVNGHPIMVGRDDVKHVIEQEIKRLRRFQRQAPIVGSMRSIGVIEQRAKADDKAARINERTGAGDAAGAIIEAGKEWDLKLVGVPNNSGITYLVTYGEMNTLGDFFGSVEELKAMDPVWVEKLIRGVRQSTMRELVKVYTDVSGFEFGLAGTAESQAHAALGMVSDEFTSRSGSSDAVELGGVLNELRLMGAVPTLFAKPQVGGEPATDYASTLARNACHFAPESWHAWHGYHVKARALAAQAWGETQAGDALEQAMGQPGYVGNPADAHTLARHREEAARLTNEAMLHNGFGDHYMQDSYAAGHLINKTLIMQQYVRWLDKNPGKWDAHRDKNWRRLQQMAYRQPGLTDVAQYDQNNVGTRNLSTGTQVESGRNPQTVENIRNGTWQEKAEALGLTVPSSLGNADAKALLVLWQEKCVTRLRIRNTRVQTYQTIKAWAAAAPNNFSAAQTLAALNALFKDGIVRKEDYESGDRRAGRQHLLQPDTELTFREEYVPTDQTKFATATATAPAFNEMALGVAYNDYLDFMNSSFLQKATNFVHDKFCLEGLRVKAGNNADIFRIYGDDSMFKANAGPGLLHSGTTAHMSRDAIVNLATGQPAVAAATILDRFPREVEVGAGTVPLDQWHTGALLTELEATIFDSMSDAGNVGINKLVVGAKPSLKGFGVLGKITDTRPTGHEVF